MAHYCHDNIKQKQILGFKVLRASRLASVVSHISLSSVRHVIGLKVNSIRFSTELPRSVRSYGSTGTNKSQILRQKIVNHVLGEHGSQ